MKNIKVPKNFSLDLEVAQRVREEKNASLIVNNLLKSYFGLGNNQTNKQTESEEDRKVREALGG
jgi:hypothetical protein